MSIVHVDVSCFGATAATRLGGVPLACTAAKCFGGVPAAGTSGDDGCLNWLISVHVKVCQQF